MDSINDIISSLSEDDIENLKGIAKDLFSGDDELPLGGDGAFNIGSLGKLMSASDDDRCRLIKALKPLLSDERQKRADEAVRLLKLASMLPAIRQSGILNNLLEGLNE